MAHRLDSFLFTHSDVWFSCEDVSLSTKKLLVASLKNIVVERYYCINLFALMLRVAVISMQHCKCSAACKLLLDPSCSILMVITFQSLDFR